MHHEPRRFGGNKCGARCLLAVYLGISAVLAGCASQLKPQPQPQPQPQPPAVVHSAPPGLALVPCPVQMQPGQQCTVAMLATQWQTSTGVQVTPGQAYCVRVPPGQVWTDWGRPNTPPQGELGNWLMRLFGGLKRHPDMAWFSLVGAVQVAGRPEPAAAQDLGQSPLLKATKAGALVLYANDAVGPPDDPSLYYRNNGGQIWVTVQRCDGQCACP